MTSEDKLREIIKTPIAIKQLTINGYKINYAVAGSGPSLLLIHGGNIGWGGWYPNIVELARYFTLYAIDLPGAGRSSHIDYHTLNPSRDFLDITKGFIQILQLKNLNILGSSIGGWVALQLAINHPTLLNKVIVEDSVGFVKDIGTSDKIISFYPLAKFISKTINHYSLKYLRDSLNVEKTQPAQMGENQLRSYYF